MLLSSLSSLGASRRLGGDAAKPNFLVLFVDDLGIDQVAVPKPAGFVGYTGNGGAISTPNVAKLASEGMLFQSWYASFHVCSPSRASMMTGRYSIRSGVGVPKDVHSTSAFSPSGNMVFTAEAVGGLPLNETTTAQALGRLGYWCGMVGKWHLGARDEYLPTSRGFDAYVGVPFSQNMGTSFWVGQEADGVFQPTPLPLLNGTTVIEQPVGLHTLAKTYADVASGFIRTQAARRVPWYVYVSFNHVHEPNSCGAAFCGRSARGALGDAVEEADWAVGRIMGALQESGADDNTLVLFTSDNGSPVHGDAQSSGNGQLRGYKGETWEGGFRVPGIARWPGRVPAGAVSHALAGIIDVHPTLLSLAGDATGGAGDALIDGMDLSPLLFASSGSSTRELGHDCIFFYWAAIASHAELGLSAVRCGAHKAYYSTHGGAPPHPYSPGRQATPLLFDVEVDPGEEHPIAPDSAAYTQARARTFVFALSPPPPPTHPTPPHSTPPLILGVPPGAQVLATITTAKKAHLATITPVPDQNGLGSDKAYAICAAPHSQQQHPELPSCTLTPENWKPHQICGMKACLATPMMKVRCKADERQQLDSGRALIAGT